MWMASIAVAGKTGLECWRITKKKFAFAVEDRATYAIQEVRKSSLDQISVYVAAYLHRLHIALLLTIALKKILFFFNKNL